MLDLAPELVGAAQQRDVGWMLPVREPDDAVRAVRRSLIVRNVELLEPKHAQSAVGELVDGGTAHPADSDHDDVVARH